MLYEHHPRLGWPLISRKGGRLQSIGKPQTSRVFHSLRTMMNRKSSSRFGLYLEAKRKQENEKVTRIQTFRRCGEILSRNAAKADLTGLQTTHSGAVVGGPVAEEYDHQPADDDDDEPIVHAHNHGNEVEVMIVNNGAFHSVASESQLDNLSAICCVPCGLDDDESIIICGIVECRNALCIKCFDENGIRIPAGFEDYICHIHSNRACHKCTKPIGSTGLTCKSCFLPFHFECAGSDRAILSDTFTCTSCRCYKCKKFSSAEVLCKCVKCSRIMHRSCDNIIEDTCSSCVANAGNSGNEILQNNTLSGANCFEDAMVLLTNEMHDATSIKSRLPKKVIESSTCIKALSVLKHKQPLKFLVYCWACQGFILDNVRYMQLIDALQEVLAVPEEAIESLRRAAPPLNVVRGLTNVLQIEIKKKTITVERNGFAVDASFFYRPLVNCILQMITSPKNREVSRFESANFRDCELGGANYGKRIPDLVSKFLSTRNTGFKGKPLVPLVQFFSDESYTKYSSFHPIFVTLQNFDRRSRASLRRTTNLVVGMVPQRISFQVSKDGTPVKMAFAISRGLLINEVIKEVKRKSHQVLFDELRTLEESGYCTEIEGLLHDIRPVLSSFVADLAGKLEFVSCLESSKFWFCNYCYHWRGNGSDELNQEIEEERVATHPSDIPISVLNNRSTINDNTLRSRFGQDGNDLNFSVSSKKKRKKEITLYDYGVQRQTISPLMLNNQQSRVFLVADSPYSILKIDFLHNLSGCVKRFYAVFRSLFGPSLDKISMAFGSKSFGNPGAFVNYKFQHMMFDFQFVVLALCEGGLASKDKDQITSTCQSVSSCFTEIMAIVKSEGAQGSIGRLRTLTSSLRESLLDLVNLTRNDPKNPTDEDSGSDSDEQADLKNLLLNQKKLLLNQQKLLPNQDQRKTKKKRNQ